MFGSRRREEIRRHAARIGELEDRLRELGELAARLQELPSAHELATLAEDLREIRAAVAGKVQRAIETHTHAYGGAGEPIKPSKIAGRR